MEKYKVTCEKCSGSDEITISPDKQIFYKEHTPIISARFRPDMKWGWECTCGQDSRIAPQEKDQLKMLVKGGEHSIKQIAKSLTPKNELRFNMKRIGG